MKFLLTQWKMYFIICLALRECQQVNRRGVAQLG